MVTSSDTRSDNETFLRGRLAAAAHVRVLPSGDEICGFRLIVTRPTSERAVSKVRIDTIDCATTLARVRRCVERAEPNDELEVTGSLRRRFWRGAGGAASRLPSKSAETPTPAIPPTN